MDYLTVTEAAKELGVTGRRVRALIADGRLKAQKAGASNLWLIRRRDLDAVRSRKPGRPRKRGQR